MAARSTQYGDLDDVADGGMRAAASLPVEPVSGPGDGQLQITRRKQAPGLFGQGLYSKLGLGSPTSAITLSSTELTIYVTGF